MTGRKFMLAFTSIFCCLFLFMNWIKVDWLTISHFTGINTSYGLVWLLLFITAFIFSLASSTNKVLGWSTFISFTLSELILIVFLINAKKIIATGTEISGFNIDHYISLEPAAYLEMVFAGLGILFSIIFLANPLEENASGIKYYEELKTESIVLPRGNEIRNHKGEVINNPYDKQRTQFGPFDLIFLVVGVIVIGGVISLNGRDGLQNSKASNLDSSKNITNTSSTIGIISQSHASTNKTLNSAAIDLFKIHSPAELMDYFGKDNVKKVKAVGYEGEDLGYEYEIFSKKNKELYFYFSGERLDYITIVRKNSYWQLPYHLTIGMPVQRVQDINEHSFTINSLGIDESGLVRDWDAEGKLLGAGLSLKFTPTKTNTDDAQFNQEDGFRSNENNIDKMGLVIEEIKVFNPDYNK